MLRSIKEQSEMFGLPFLSENGDWINFQATNEW